MLQMSNQGSVGSSKRFDAAHEYPCTFANAKQKKEDSFTEAQLNLTSLLEAFR